MKRITVLFFGLILSFAQANAQGKVIIEGYAYEENDRGFLGDVNVILFTSQMIRVAEASTDEFGHFVFESTDDRNYVVRANKKLYIQKEVKVDVTTKNDANKVFLKVEMEREPGYIFDVTLAEPRPAPDAPTNSVEGATIEIYNNTTKKMEWVSEAHPSPYFKFTFQQGNHYTIMISKKNYITKQIEAYVNVHGCIVCIEGVDNVKPGIVDNLTAGHQKGTLLANIEMRPVKIGEKIPIDNLYYGSGRFSVKKSMHKTLDELIVLMKNNPTLIVELRSHTDCKGDKSFNQKLSLKRARAAVKYILGHSDIDKFRIKAVGMGETKPVSKCKDCRTCSDAKLARNRRTDLVITGLLSDKSREKLPLTKKVEAIRMEELLEEVMGGEQVQIPAGGEMPEELKKQLEKEKQAKNGNVKVETQKVVLEKEDSFEPVEVQKEEEQAQKVKVDLPKPEKVAVKTPKEEKVDLPKPEKVATETAMPDKIDPKKEKELEAAQRRAKAAFEKKTKSKGKTKIEEVKADLPKPEKVEVTTPEEVKVDLPTPEKVEVTAPEEAKVDLPKPEKVEVTVPEEVKVDLPKVKKVKVDKKKELDEAKQRAAAAFKDKEVVAPDPDVRETEEMPNVSVTEDVPDTVVKEEPGTKIVQEVDLGSMDISRKITHVGKVYTGFKIEVKRSRFELPASDVVFSDYPDVQFFELANGSFIYLSGDFATRTVADIGLSYIRKQNPGAKLHLFRKGKMVD